MLSKFIYSLKGGSSPELNLHLENATKETSEKINQSINNLNEIKRNLTSEFLPGENHLSLIAATEIGCHHPEISFTSDLSAMALHLRDGLCTSCSNRFKVDISRGEFNPFRCWRRGHRSGNFGFLYRFSLKQDNHRKWIIRKQEKYNSILASKLVSSSLQHYFSRNDRRVNQYTNFDILKSNLSNVMLVAINILDEVIIETTEIDQLTSLLPSQRLVSSQIDQDSILNQIMDYTQLPNLVGEILESIHSKWKNNSMSSQSSGILSIAIIHNGYNDLVKSLEPSVREKNIVDSERFSVIESGTLGRNFLEEFNADLVNNEGLTICLILDPIVDLGVSKLA